MTLPDLGLDLATGELDWDAIDARFEWVRAMKGCAQDPIHHAEGDVWIHTRLVLEALVQLDAFRTLDEESRWVVFAGALLHDVSKPETTREEGGRITARGHSAAGAIRARRILWELETPAHLREEVCRIVASHQVPFFLALQESPQRKAIRLSWQLRCDRLALVTEADGRGRECADQDDLIARVELFRELCREHGALQTPYRFQDAFSAFQYFRTDGRNPHHRAYDDTRGEVVVLCGLPASGKDTWIAEHGGRDVVSLDAIRFERGIDPADAGAQRAVVAEAQERLRALLREGRSVVINATNLRRSTRQRWIDLAVDYRMRPRIVHLETSPEEQKRRNRERHRPVPVSVLERMLERWQAPTPDEAPDVDYVVT